MTRDTQWRKDSLFYKWYWEVYNHMQKNETGPFSTPLKKINLKYRLKYMIWNSETIRRKQGKGPGYWSWQQLFGYVTKCISNKSKNKLKYIKLKSFCTAKEMINKMKRQHTEQKKLFAKHQSDMGLIMKNIRNPYNSVA